MPIDVRNEKNKLINKMPVATFLRKDLLLRVITTSSKEVPRFSKV